MRVALVFCMVLLTAELAAQFDMNNLKSSNPPAAVILGYTPTTLDNITSPQLISAQVSTAFSTTGTLNPNINFELSPFWLIRRNNLSMDAIVADNNWFHHFYRSLGFSFATAQSDTSHYGNVGKALGLACGLRCNLVNRVNYSPKYQASITDYMQYNTYPSLNFNAEAQGVMASLQHTMSDSAFNALSGNAKKLQVLYNQIMLTLQGDKLNEGDIQEQADAANVYNNILTDSISIALNATRAAWVKTVAKMNNRHLTDCEKKKWKEECDERAAQYKLADSLQKAYPNAKYITDSLVAYFPNSTPFKRLFAAIANITTKKDDTLHASKKYLGMNVKTAKVYESWQKISAKAFYQQQEIERDTAKLNTEKKKKIADKIQIDCEMCKWKETVKCGNKKKRKVNVLAKKYPNAEFVTDSLVGVFGLDTGINTPWGDLALYVFGSRDIISKGAATETAWMKKAKALYTQQMMNYNTCQQQKLDSSYCEDILSPQDFYQSLLSVFAVDTTVIPKQMIIVDSMYNNPDGFSLDLDAAFSGLLPNDSVQRSCPAQFAVWLVPTFYRFTFDNRHPSLDPKSKKTKGVAGFVDIMGIARFTYNYRKDTLHIDTANYVDLGGKIAFTINSFSASVEAVWRDAVKFVTQTYNYPFQVKNTWHITASADYKVSSLFDISMSFGRNFNGKAAAFDKAAPGALYYVAGLNFGFGALASSKTASK